MLIDEGQNEIGKGRLEMIDVNCDCVIDRKRLRRIDKGSEQIEKYSYQKRQT